MNPSPETIDLDEKTELFELCKEVYKRFPNWKDGLGWYTEAFSVGGEVGVAPRYTSDFILEKLKSGAGVIKDSDGYTARRPSKLGVFPVGYKDPLGGRIGWQSDTAVKALLTMVIALDNAKELS